MLGAVLWFLGSAMLTDLAGYWLHRWAHVPGSPLFRAHMTHHRNYPPRAVVGPRYRTSGSDSLVIWFAPFLLAYLVLLWAVPAVPFWPAMFGAIAVAAASAILHDLSHLRGSVVWRAGWFRGIAVRHHAHHFRMRRNFGVLVPLWDVLFRTRKPAHGGEGTEPMTQRRRHDR